MEEIVHNQQCLNVLRKQKNAHEDMVICERGGYKNQKDKAILNPEEVVSIIVDEDDQSAFELPHCITNAKIRKTIFNQCEADWLLGVRQTK